MFFWGLGFPQLININAVSDAPTANIGVPTISFEKAPRDLVKRLLACLKDFDSVYFERLFRELVLSPTMIAIYLGILIGMIPALQDVLFVSSTAVKPLGDTLVTLADPLICVSCVVMAASLAQVYFSRQVRPSSSATEVDDRKSIDVRYQHSANSQDSKVDSLTKTATISPLHNAAATLPLQQAGGHAFDELATEEEKRQENGSEEEAVRIDMSLPLAVGQAMKVPPEGRGLGPEPPSAGSTGPAGEGGPALPQLRSICVFIAAR